MSGERTGPAVPPLLGVGYDLELEREGSFEQVQVLGPYNSGTNLLERYRRAVTRTPDPWGEVFFKHAIPPAYEDGEGSVWARSSVTRSEVFRDTLFLCLVRSPWTWLRSVVRRSYGLKFLASRGAASTLHERIRSPVELWGRRYPTPVELWNTVYRSYRRSLEPIAQLAYVRLEDLVLEPRAVLEDLCRLVPPRPGIDLDEVVERISAEPAKSHFGEPCTAGETARRRARPEAVFDLMNRSEIDWIEQRLDPELLERFRYALPERMHPTSPSEPAPVPPTGETARRGSTRQVETRSTTGPADPWMPERSPRVVTWRDGGSLVVSPPGGSDSFLLSDRAAIFWDLCDGSRPVESIVREFHRLAPGAGGPRSREPFAILEELVERGVLVGSETPPSEKRIGIDLREIPCFVLHCPDDGNRGRHIQSELSRLDLRWRMVHGVRADPKHVGVAISHLKVLRSPRARPPFLVLEDDCVATSAFRPQLEVPAEAAALYLGVSTFGLPMPGLMGFGEANATRWADWDQEHLRVVNMLARHAVLYLSSDFQEQVARGQVEALTSASGAQAGDIACARLHLSHLVLTPRTPFFQQRYEPATWRALPEALPAGGQREENPAALYEPRSRTQKPIFIGGCARSGTTLVASLLSAHRSVFVLGRDGWNDETRALTRGMRPRHLMDLARLLLEMPEGCTHWCEKTPLNVRSIGPILDHFGPDARFVNVVRDGRDVVTSVHPQAPDRAWVQPDRWIEDVVAGLRHEGDPRVVTIRYEDLVGDWVAEMRRLCAAIGLEFDPAIEDFPDKATIRRSEAWFGPARVPDSSSVGRWRASPHAQKAEELVANEEAVRLLRHYGYLAGNETAKEQAATRRARRGRPSARGL